MPHAVRHDPCTNQASVSVAGASVPRGPPPFPACRRRQLSIPQCNVRSLSSKSRAPPFPACRRPGLAAALVNARRRCARRLCVRVPMRVCAPRARQMAVMIMEALDGFAHKYSWSLVPPPPQRCKLV